MKQTQAPIITKSNSVVSESRENHPAYGVVVLTKGYCSGDQVMFGSEVGHRTIINLKVQTAYKDRSLHNDWIHGDETLVSLSFSPAQWGQFVSSIGDGSGTPCTLNYRQVDGKIIELPYIERIEGVSDKFAREAKERGNKFISGIESVIDELKSLSEDKTISKPKLKSLINNLASMSANLPSNLQFSHNQFAESMDAMVNEVKSEIDSFLQLKAMQTGIAAIRHEISISGGENGSDSK